MRNARSGGLLVGLAAVAVVLAPAAPQPASSAAVRPDSGAVQYLAGPAAERPASRPRLSPFSVLQLNLCNSGFASCYAGGQAVPEAARVIRTQRPDVVTLNEICQGDSAGALLAAMQRTWPADRVFANFQPAWDRGRDAPYRCRNGQQYGIALMGHVAPANWAGVATRGGIYPTQNPDRDEQRAWVCAYAIGNYYACATHLESGSGGTAKAQCRYLLGTAIPGVQAALGGAAPTVVGGDFNLAYGGDPDVQDCVPSGWSRKGDGAVQHVLATGDFTVRSTRATPLRHTDHPAWLVALQTP